MGSLYRSLQVEYLEMLSRHGQQPPFQVLKLCSSFRDLYTLVCEQGSKGKDFLTHLC